MTSPTAFVERRGERLPGLLDCLTVVANNQDFWTEDVVRYIRAHAAQKHLSTRPKEGGTNNYDIRTTVVDSSTRPRQLCRVVGCLPGE